MPILLTTWMSLLLLAGGGDPWPSLNHGLAVTGGGHGDAAVIVGVEDYTYLPDVQGATANTLAWYRYLTKARKVLALAISWSKPGRHPMEL